MLLHEQAKYFSMTVTPQISGDLIYFNFSARGGSACWNRRTHEWKSIRGEVDERAKAWLRTTYDLDNVK